MRRAYASVADPDLEPARALAERVKAGELPDPFTYRDVYRRCWSQLDDPDTVRRAVAILEGYGWLRAVDSSTGGRPRTDIQIHPELPRKPPEDSDRPRMGH
jgi:putative DNA primase/helicase